MIIDASPFACVFAYLTFFLCRVYAFLPVPISLSQSKSSVLSWRSPLVAPKTGPSAYYSGIQAGVFQMTDIWIGKLEPFIVAWHLVKGVESWIPHKPVTKASAFFWPSGHLCCWLSRALAYGHQNGRSAQGPSFLATPSRFRATLHCFPAQLTSSCLSPIASCKFPLVFMLNILYLTLRTFQPSPARL